MLRRDRSVGCRPKPAQQRFQQLSSSVAQRLNSSIVRPLNQSHAMVGRIKGNNESIENTLPDFTVGMGMAESNLRIRETMSADHHLALKGRGKNGKLSTRRTCPGNLDRFVP
jgi:hypothetical protein